ncbi:MAG: fibronectin type III domain-containing protein [Gallionella sp.]|nr:fibronectin type III domain-containing protein [Gallionella sp.]MDD4947498.1 fibronectin type III domain-containing protein [Gallionella sp.]
MVNGPSSAASNSVIPSIAVPGAPQNVSATGGATRASVSFNPPASDGGSPILGYTVTASPAGPTDSNANGTALTHLITGLVGGTTYTFTVTASNLAGSGPASLPSNRITANATEGQTYYIHADHLDTPRVITDTSGNVVWQRDNVDPFNNNVPNENPSGLGKFTCNLGFPGQYFDIETGLFYNSNRYYDSATGRYTQSDPIGLAAGINTYAYVGGNPLGYADPDGLARKLDPNSQECKSLKDKIQKRKEKINERIRECKANPNNLPYYPPYSGAPQRMSVQGHEEIIQEQKDYLKDDEALYEEKCGGGDGGGTAPITDQEKKAAATAAGAGAAYWIISETLRVLFPPRNLVPLP